MMMCVYIRVCAWMTLMQVYLLEWQKGNESRGCGKEEKNNEDT